MGTILYCYAFFSASFAFMRAIYHLATHECPSYAFYAACNDAYLRFFVVNFVISMILTILSILKSLAFGDFRLIEIQVFLSLIN